MPINKVELEQNGLVVGDNQLATTGGGVYIKRNLIVDGSVIVTGNIDATFARAFITRPLFSNTAAIAGIAGSIDAKDVFGVLPVKTGGTGAITAANALINLGAVSNQRATALSLLFR
jgi:hypothetical protein